MDSTEHPFLTQLAQQKERELLDLATDGAGATVVEPLPPPRPRSLPPRRRVTQRKEKVKLDNGWLRALERLA